MLLLLIPLGFSVQPDSATSATLGGLTNGTEYHLVACSIETAMLNPTTTRECLQHAQGMFHFSLPNREEFESGVCIRVGNWWTHIALADVAANRLLEFPSECACPQDSQSSLREFLSIVKRLVNHFTAALSAELSELKERPDITALTYEEADYSYDSYNDSYDYNADESYDAEAQRNFMRDPNVSIEQKLYRQLFVCDGERKYSPADECDEIIATLVQAHGADPSWQRVAAVKDIQTKIGSGLCCPVKMTDWE